MDTDLGHWSEPYSSLYGSMGNNDEYMESSDVGYDMHYSPAADPNIMIDFIHPSVSISFILMRSDH